MTVEAARSSREEDRARYTISVAADLAGMHPQTLRQYDRLGLVTPGRTAGRGRRYSERDVRTLREIQRLSQVEGVNLAGIKKILALQAEVDRLREIIERLRPAAEPGHRVFAAGPEGDVVAIARGARPVRRPRTTAATGRSLVLWRST